MLCSLLRDTRCPKLVIGRLAPARWGQPRQLAHSQPALARPMCRGVMANVDGMKKRLSRGVALGLWAEEVLRVVVTPPPRTLIDLDLVDTWEHWG